MNRLKVIALLLMISILGIGCTKNKPIIKYETVEIIRDRYVAIPASLTEHEGVAELPPREEWDELPGKDKLITLGVLFHYNRTRALQCFGNLDEIRSLQPQN